MLHLYDLLVAPFAEFAFMRRALVGRLALALGSGPIGLFLVMRRMSLMGDAMSHAVLPGAAVGFMMAGLSLPAMSIGGFFAGVLVALLAGLATRFTSIRRTPASPPSICCPCPSACCWCRAAAAMWT